jgi:hypothetical protein
MKSASIQGLIRSLAVVAALPSGALAQPVGNEFRVNTYTTGRQYDGAVASGPSGNFVVVWYSYQDGSGFGVYGQRYDSQGSAVGPEFRVNTDTTSHQGTPSAAMDASGASVVAWGSHFGDGPYDLGLRAQRYDPAGNPAGPEFRINTFTPGIQAGPVVAVRPGGDFVVVWYSLGQDGSNYGAFGQRYDSGGNALGGEFRVNSYTTGGQADASVAWLASGGFVITWDSYGQDGSSFGVFGQVYDSGGTPVGGEFQVNGVTAGYQFYPDVAAVPGGGFVVVWAGEDGSDRGVFGRRFDSAGTPTGPEFPVNTYATGTQRRSSIASAADGSFTVVWTDYGGADGSGRGVFGRRFDSSGRPVGAEIQVNTYTTGLQRASLGDAVSSDPLGNLVVVWHSDGQDGSDYGVFAQRYASLALTVSIDIKPGRFPNTVNPAGPGVIPVAVLTTGTFDARAARVRTVRFGRTGNEAAPVHSSLEDVDHDGDLDRLLEFRIRDTGIRCGDTLASLTGQTRTEQAFRGSDSILTVRCP